MVVAQYYEVDTHAAPDQPHNSRQGVVKRRAGSNITEISSNNTPVASELLLFKSPLVVVDWLLELIGYTTQKFPRTMNFIANRQADFRSTSDQLQVCLCYSAFRPSNLALYGSDHKSRDNYKWV